MSGNHILQFFFLSGKSLLKLFISVQRDPVTALKFQ